jgi:hypothetical protein
MIDADFADEPDCLVSLDLEERIKHLMDGGCESCEETKPVCSCGHAFRLHDDTRRSSGSVCIIGCDCHRYAPLKIVSDW